MAERGASSRWVQTTPGTISDHSMMPKVFFFQLPQWGLSSVSFAGVHICMGADQHPRRWHEPWGGVASPVFLDTASLASILVVTAAGEELYSLFLVAWMEIEGGRTEQAWLQCANWAHNKLLTHLGVPPPGHRHYIYINISFILETHPKEGSEREASHDFTD